MNTHGRLIISLFQIIRLWFKFVINNLKVNIWVKYVWNIFMNKIHYISFNSFFSHFQIHLYDYLQNLLVWKCYEENKLTHLQLVLWISDFQFLAHLGQRLKWTFLIKICPLMSIIIIIIVIVIDIACLNFSYFICLRTLWPNSTKLFLKHPWNEVFQNF